MTTRDQALTKALHSAQLTRHKLHVAEAKADPILQLVLGTMIDQAAELEEAISALRIVLETIQTPQIIVPPPP